MFAHGPTVEYAGLLGEIADERITTDADTLHLDLADEDAQGL
jgi:hypothetical protein